MSTVGIPGAIRQPPAQSGNFGQGATYPLEYTATGAIKLSYGATLAEEGMRAILETVPGERPMLPGFGAAVGPFEPIDVFRMIAKFKIDVKTYLPLVETVDVTTNPGPSQEEVTMNIAYTLKDDADEHTLTYPLFTGASS